MAITVGCASVPECTLTGLPDGRRVQLACGWKFGPRLFQPHHLDTVSVVAIEPQRYVCSEPRWVSGHRASHCTSSRRRLTFKQTRWDAEKRSMTESDRDLEAARPASILGDTVACSCWVSHFLGFWMQAALEHEGQGGTDSGRARSP
jgi:hypothetical protein